MHIQVTKPFLPPLEEFQNYLREIWECRILTNGGPNHQKLEEELAAYLGVKYLSLFGNGTLALITALQALRVSGEVITTPYSFVATTHALRWNGIKPIFCDIDPHHYNIDVNKIEAAITPKTTAILPVHIYGTPCDVERLNEISTIYGLKVIYDACHAFGVKLNGESILNFGDLSVLSFHATKVFQTFEGGAIICHDSASKKRIDFLKNFGYNGEESVIASGINAKMNEFQAALGLLQLKYIDEIIARRKYLFFLYINLLADLPGVTPLTILENIDANFGYFPILIDPIRFGRNRDEVHKNLQKKGIYTRKYFFPLISNFPMYSGLQSSNPDNLPVSTHVSSRILCLPLYPDLKDSDVDFIVCHLKNLRK